MNVRMAGSRGPEPVSGVKPGGCMSPSRPFILRPVATSLLMAGSAAGRRGRLQAVAGLGAAAGGLSDHPGGHVLSGSQPGGDGVVGHRAARTPVRPGARAEPDDVDQFFRSSVITLQFVLDLNIDVAEQQVQAAINAAGTFLPPDSAESADLQQDQSGRRADPHAGADLENHGAVQGGGFRRHAPGAENFAACPASGW